MYTKLELIFEEAKNDNDIFTMMVCKENLKNYLDLFSNIYKEIGGLSAKINNYFTQAEKNKANFDVSWLRKIKDYEDILKMDSKAFDRMDKSWQIAKYEKLIKIH